MNYLLVFLKYWKYISAAILTVAFLLAVHLASSRGAKLDELAKALKAEQAQNAQQIKIFEQLRSQERERNDFRIKQQKKIKLAHGDRALVDPDLRLAYEQLRARRSDRAGK